MFYSFMANHNKMVLTDPIPSKSYYSMISSLMKSISINFLINLFLSLFLLDINEFIQ